MYAPNQWKLHNTKTNYGSDQGVAVMRPELVSVGNRVGEPIGNLKIDSEGTPTGKLEGNLASEPTETRASVGKHSMPSGPEEQESASQNGYDPNAYSDAMQQLRDELVVPALDVLRTAVKEAPSAPSVAEIFATTPGAYVLSDNPNPNTTSHVQSASTTLPHAPSYTDEINHIGTQTIRVYCALQQEGMAQYLFDQVKCRFEDMHSQINTMKQVSPELYAQRLREVSTVRMDADYVVQYTQKGVFNLEYHAEAKDRGFEPFHVIEFEKENWTSMLEYIQAKGLLVKITLPAQAMLLWLKYESLNENFSSLFSGGMAQVETDVMESLNSFDKMAVRFEDVLRARALCMLDRETSLCAFLFWEQAVAGNDSNSLKVDAGNDSNLLKVDALIASCEATRGGTMAQINTCILYDLAIGRGVLHAELEHTMFEFGAAAEPEYSEPKRCDPPEPRRTKETTGIVTQNVGLADTLLLNQVVFYAYFLYAVKTNSNGHEISQVVRDRYELGFNIQTTQLLLQCANDNLETFLNNCNNIEKGDGASITTSDIALVVFDYAYEILESQIRLTSTASNDVENFSKLVKCMVQNIGHESQEQSMNFLTMLMFGDDLGKGRVENFPSRWMPKIKTGHQSAGGGGGGRGTVEFIDNELYDAVYMTVKVLIEMTEPVILTFLKVDVEDCIYVVTQYVLLSADNVEIFDVKAIFRKLIDQYKQADPQIPFDTMLVKSKFKSPLMPFGGDGGGGRRTKVQYIQECRTKLDGIAYGDDIAQQWAMCVSVHILEYMKDIVREPPSSQPIIMKYFSFKGSTSVADGTDQAEAEVTAWEEKKGLFSRLCTIVGFKMATLMDFKRQGGVDAEDFPEANLEENSSILQLWKGIIMFVSVEVLSSSLLSSWGASPLFWELFPGTGRTTGAHGLLQSGHDGIIVDNYVNVYNESTSWDGKWDKEFASVLEKADRALGRLPRVDTNAKDSVLMNASVVDEWKRTGLANDAFEFAFGRNFENPGKPRVNMLYNGKVELERKEFNVLKEYLSQYGQSLGSFAYMDDAVKEAYKSLEANSKAFYPVVNGPAHIENRRLLQEHVYKIYKARTRGDFVFQDNITDSLAASIRRYFDAARQAMDIEVDSARVNSVWFVEVDETERGRGSDGGDFITLFRVNDAEKHTADWLQGENNTDTRRLLNATGQLFAMGDANKFLDSDNSLSLLVAIAGLAIVAMCSAYAGRVAYDKRKRRIDNRNEKEKVVQNAKTDYSNMVKHLDKVSFRQSFQARNTDHNAPRVRSDIYVYEGSARNWTQIFGSQRQVSSPYVMINAEYSDCPCSTLLMACANSSQFRYDFFADATPGNSATLTNRSDNADNPLSCYREYLELFDGGSVPPVKSAEFKLLCVATLIRHCVAKVVRDEVCKSVIYINANKPARKQIILGIQLRASRGELLYCGPNDINSANADQQCKAIESATYFIIDGVRLNAQGILEDDRPKLAIGIGKKVGSTTESNTKALYTTAEQNIGWVVCENPTTEGRDLTQSHAKVPTLEECLKSVSETHEIIDSRKKKMEYLEREVARILSGPVVQRSPTPRTTRRPRSRISNMA